MLSVVEIPSFMPVSLLFIYFPSFKEECFLFSSYSPNLEPEGTSLLHAEAHGGLSPTFLIFLGPPIVPIFTVAVLAGI